MPPFDSLKATFPIFQNPLEASGLVATPISPIPPERASGEIRKKGTAVVTTLISPAEFWAFVTGKIPQKNKIPAVSFLAIGLIRMYFYKLKFEQIITKTGPRKY